MALPPHEYDKGVEQIAHDNRVNNFVTGKPLRTIDDHENLAAAIEGEQRGVVDPLGAPIPESDSREN